MRSDNFLWLVFRIAFFCIGLFNFVVATTNGSVITQDDVRGGILDTICTIKLWEQVYRELDFCREDDVSDMDCSKLLVLIAQSIVMNDPQ